MITASIAIVAGELRKFKDKIISYLADKIDRLMNSKKVDLLILKEEIRAAIIGSPEYSALINGSLYGEFGVPDIERRLNAVIDVFVDSIRTDLDVKSTKNKIRADISFVINKTNYDKILSMSEATFTTEKGNPLEWLRWLLLEGDKYIVIGYTIITKPKYSRTGTNIMISSNSVPGWRVPPQYAGTEENNFITRAIEKAMTKFIEDFKVGVING